MQLNSLKLLGVTHVKYHAIRFGKYVVGMNNSRLNNLLISMGPRASPKKLHVRVAVTPSPIGVPSKRSPAWSVLSIG